MQFLYPIGLMALASLIVPIIIHLWYIKKGKTLKIGSISLMGESASSQAKSLQISDWPLLLLRCLLMALLAFLISKPYLQGEPISKRQKGWILLSQDQLKSIYRSERKTIDSLLLKGYQIRHFGYGFKQLQLQDTAATDIDTGKNTQHLNYSSLLKQANHQLPNQYPVWIFAVKNLSEFDEVLPSLHLHLNWKAIGPTDTLNKSYTQFLNRNYQVQPSAQAINYNIIENKSLPALQVAVFPSNTEDTKYVKAAVKAISDYVNQPVIFNSSDYTKKDVVFWLSADKKPTQVLNNIKKDGILFSYASGKLTNYNSFPVIKNEKTNSFQRSEIFKRIISKNTATALWTDGFGNPLLSFEEQKDYKTYTFYSQFNPKWTDLVWQESFVTALFPIVHGQNPVQFGFVPQPNQQLASDEPIADFNKSSSFKELLTANKSLENILWVLALLCLIAERILTFSRKAERATT